MQGLIRQFVDFPGLCTLSHQLPGALGRKVLAEDRLVFGLKRGLLTGPSWVFPSMCEGPAGLDGSTHTFSEPQREKEDPPPPPRNQTPAC